MLAATATVALRDLDAFTESSPGKGYGLDPSMVKVYQPGDVWPLTFTDAQRRTARALCDDDHPGGQCFPRRLR